MYFQLKRDPFIDIAIDGPTDLPFDSSFIRGARLALASDAVMVFTTNATCDNVLPDFSGGSIPVMSENFVSLLERAGVDGLQKFPIVIKSAEDGTLWQGYYAVNILQLISCADLARSDYGEICPGLYDFDVIAIDTAKLNGQLLFRLAESPSTIIIHKSVGRYIMEQDPEQRLTGWDVEEIIQ